MLRNKDTSHDVIIFGFRQKECQEKNDAQ